MSTDPSFQSHGRDANVFAFERPDIVINSALWAGGGLEYIAKQQSTFPRKLV